MKNQNTSITVDATGVSEWWFTRNIIAGLFGIAVSLSLNIARADDARAEAVAEPEVPAAIASR